MLFIKARLEHVAELSLPKGYTYTITVRVDPTSNLNLVLATSLAAEGNS